MYLRVCAVCGTKYAFFILSVHRMLDGKSNALTKEHFENNAYIKLISLMKSDKFPYRRSLDNKQAKSHQLRLVL